MTLVAIMKGQIKYFSVLLGLIMSIVSSGLICTYSYVLWKALLEPVPSISVLLGVIFMLLISILLACAALRLLIKERFNFEITDNGIEIIDLFCVSTQFIPYQDVKGYSTGIVRTRFDSFQQVVLYAWNGDVYQIIQRNFRNFNELKKVIKQGGNLTYLGKERLIWTWRIVLKDLFSPQYKFR